MDVTRAENPARWMGVPLLTVQQAVKIGANSTMLNSNASPLLPWTIN